MPPDASSGCRATRCTPGHPAPSACPSSSAPPARRRSRATRRPERRRNSQPGGRGEVGVRPHRPAAIAAQGGASDAAAVAAVAAVAHLRVAPNAAGGTKPRQWMVSSPPRPEPRLRRRRCCLRCLGLLRQPSTRCPSSHPPLVRPSRRRRRRGCPPACLRAGCWRRGAGRPASCSHLPPCRSHSPSSQCRPWVQARPAQRSTQATIRFRGRLRPRCSISSNTWAEHAQACRQAVQV